MIVVNIELWPHGNEQAKRPLGKIVIANDGTGSIEQGNYVVAASHAGRYYGTKPEKEPYKQGRVLRFGRKLSPYRLLFRALKAIGEI